MRTLEKLDLIQFARGIAAVAVAVFHTIGGQRYVEPDYMIFAGFDGSWGVDLFFVISGFIMVYINQEGASGVKNARSFFYRRVARVVPLYWFYTAITVLVLYCLGLQLPTITRLLTSLFFIPDGFPVLLLGWTLNYELYFYVVFSLALLFPQRHRLWLLTGWFFITCLPGAIQHPLQKYWDFTDITFYSNPIVLEFLMGIYIAHFYLSGKILAKWASYILILGSFTAIFLASAYFGDMEKYRAYFWGIPAAAIIYGFLSIQYHGVSSPVFMKHLGDASYSIYLCHLPVFVVLSQGWGLLGIGGYLANASYLVVTLVVIYYVANASYRYIELPAQRWLNRLAPR
tara:strand:+ start:1602 stop:2630 length:1029 start_codon:yes stop_codon:yes gene_type:complete